MFDLAIDSKLRGCDVVRLKVEDVCSPWSCSRSGNRTPEEDGSACQVRDDGTNPRGDRLLHRIHPQEAGPGQSRPTLPLSSWQVSANFGPAQSRASQRTEVAERRAYPIRSAAANAANCPPLGNRFLVRYCRWARSRQGTADPRRTLASAAQRPASFEQRFGPGDCAGRAPRSGLTSENAGRVLYASTPLIAGP